MSAAVSPQSVLKPPTNSLTGAPPQSRAGSSSAAASSPWHGSVPGALPVSGAGIEGSGSVSTFSVSGMSSLDASFRLRAAVSFSILSGACD